MSGWPILSLVTFLPLVGVAILLAMAATGENGRQNVLYISLFTTVVTFLLSLVIWIGLRQCQCRVPVHREDELAQYRHFLPCRC